ncbi:MAG: RHS repeat protein, partial [Planctomycetota bacterium]
MATAPPPTRRDCQPTPRTPYIGDPLQCVICGQVVAEAGSSSTTAPQQQAASYKQQEYACLQKPVCNSCRRGSPAGTPQYGVAGGALDRVAQVTTSVDRQQPPALLAAKRGGGDGPVLVDPAAGNLSFHFDLPFSGSAAPRAGFTYHSIGTNRAVAGAECDAGKGIWDGWSSNLSLYSFYGDGMFFTAGGGGAIQGPLNVLESVPGYWGFMENSMTPWQYLDTVYGQPDTLQSYDDFVLGGNMGTRQPDGFQVRWNAITNCGIGKLGGFVGAGGQRWTFVYQDSPNIDKIDYIVDPCDRRTSFSYDNSRIHAIEESGGRRTTFVTTTITSRFPSRYISVLSKVITPELCETEFRYTIAEDIYDLNDGFPLMTAWIAPDQRRTSFAYDNDMRVSEITWPDDTTARYTYIEDNTNQTGRSEFTDRGGNVTVITYMYSGEYDPDDGLEEEEKLITAVREPGGEEWLFKYDTGRLTAFTDPRGCRTTFTYKPYAFTFSATFPNFPNVTYTYTTESCETASGKFEFVYRPNELYAPSEPQVQAIVDELGNRTTLLWDENNQYLRTGVIDSKNARYTYTYDGHGQMVTVENPLNLVTTHVYDSASDDLIAIVNPMGERTTFAYNAMGQLISTTDPLSHVTTTVYDLLNRPIASVDPLGSRTTMSYTLMGKLESMEDPLNQVTTYLYDACDRLHVSIDPLGQRTTYGYDDRDLQVTLEDPLGLVVTSVYDDNSRLVATVNPLGERTTTVYDGSGNIESVEDPLGLVTTSVYDANNRFIASVNPAGERTSVSYDAVGNQIATTDPLGNVSTTVYDSLNLPIASVNPLGERTTTVYDVAGRTIESIDPLDQVSTTVYDAASRTIASVNPLGERTTTVYDVAGRTIESIDPLDQVSTTVYDAASRTIASVNPLGERTTTVYDVAGRTIESIDPLDQVSTTVYDAASRTIASVNPLGERTTTVYDVAGR